MRSYKLITSGNKGWHGSCEILIKFSEKFSVWNVPKLMIIKFYFIYIVSLIYYWLTFFFYRFNPDTGLLGMSYSVFKMSDLHPLGKLILSVFSLLRLVTVEEGVGEDKKSTRVNNLTLINFVIKVLGPLHERTLTIIIMGIQVKLWIKNLSVFMKDHFTAT